MTLKYTYSSESKSFGKTSPSWKSNKLCRKEHAHHLLPFLMHITFNTTVALILQTSLRGIDTDELLTFSHTVQMEWGLCGWLSMPENKLWTHTIWLIHHMYLWHGSACAGVFNLPHANSCTHSFFPHLMWADPWMKMCSRHTHTHYLDQNDLSDLLLCTILKTGVIYIVYVLFEVHMLNICLNGTKK